MEYWTRRVFLQEIEVQCRWALRAYDDMLDQIELTPRYGGSGRTFSAVQAFLTAVANVSKIFCTAAYKSPPAWRQRCEDRGRLLRRLLKVTKRSPVLSRKLRDDYEHFEERIQDWADKPASARGAPVDGILIKHGEAWAFIGPVGMTTRPPTRKDSMRCLRVLYFPEMTATFYHHRYNLERLRNELERIMNAANGETMKMMLYPEDYR